MRVVSGTPLTGAKDSRLKKFDMVAQTMLHTAFRVLSLLVFAVGTIHSEPRLLYKQSN